MPSPLLAGIFGAALLAAPVEAAPRESPWSASIMGGPVTIYTPIDLDEDFTDEFTVRAGVSREIIGPWDGVLEAGYTRFGFYYDSLDDRNPEIASDGEFHDSFDVSLGTRWHPNIRTFHPYVTVGAGAHAVHGYFPDANPLKLSRQVKPGVYAGVGLHGVLVPALGAEVRWLTIYENTGAEVDRNRDLLSILFSLTRE